MDGPPDDGPVRLLSPLMTRGWVTQQVFESQSTIYIDPDGEEFLEVDQRSPADVVIIFEKPGLPDLRLRRRADAPETKRARRAARATIRRAKAKKARRS